MQHFSLSTFFFTLSLLLADFSGPKFLLTECSPFVIVDERRDFLSSWPAL